MDLQKYLTATKKIQIDLLRFIDDEDNLEENYQNFIKIINDEKVTENKCFLNDLLHLLSKISENHRRSIHLFDKITRILDYLKSYIQQQLTKGTIYKIFKSNNKILQYFFENKILEADYQIFKMIQNTDGNQLAYFYPEFNEIIQKEIDNNQFEELPYYDFVYDAETLFDENPTDFIKKREKGENDSEICEYIQKDLIEEFITYVNRNDYCLRTQISNSIFETNSFLIKNKNVELIEYAAFFGSIQIFRYLYKNNIKLTPSLWLYAIHGDNPEIISILEKENVLPKDQTYKNCFIEAIKCHHNETAQWIESNLLKNISIDLLDVIEFFNFNFIDESMLNSNSFRYLCEYDYSLLAQIYLKNLSIDINQNLVLYINFNAVLFLCLNDI